MTTSFPHTAPAADRWPPFRRVLAASFLDPSGVGAVLRAARLPLAPGARLTVLHVVAPWPLHRPSVRAARRVLDRLAAAGVDAAVAAGNRDPELVPVVSEGWPATEIVRTAWQEGAEIIVVGPPAVGAGGSLRSTVFRVLRRADLPLLVARSDALKSYFRVLCAVDRSVTAVEPIALAARIARATARELTLFHAYHAPFEPWVADAPELGTVAAAHVRALARTVSEVPSVRTLIRKGDPCVEVLRAALEQRADLVVLGTHGRSGLSRAIRGSAAEWLIANAPCDVAVARPHRLTLEPR